MLVGQGFDADRRAELLRHIALETAGGVKCRGGKRSDEHAHQSRRKGGAQPEGLDEVSRAGNKRADRRGEAAGILPRCVTGIVSGRTKQRVAGDLPVDDLGDAEADPGNAGQNHQHREEALGQHRAVADELGVGLTSQLFR